MSDGLVIPSSTVLPLFVYGTLMDPAVRSRVLGTGRNVTDRAARLAGYRRVNIPGFEYPVIAAGTSGDSVEGRLLGGLTPEDYALLDEYEDVDGGLYERVRVAADTEDGRVPAWVYVEGPTLRG